MTTFNVKSIMLLDKETRREMSDRFSRFVFEYKRAHKLDTLRESLQDIVENCLFEGIGWDNVNKFVDENLKNKLMIECTHARLIKDEHIPKKMKQSEALF